MKKKNTRTEGTRYYPKRYDFDPNTRDTILDEGLVCHVGFSLDNQPVVLPTGYCRHENTLYLHGSVGSHFFRAMAQGIPVCVTVTHVDALVLARSVFNHSMNYRSVVAFGKSRLVTDAEECIFAAKRFTDHVLPGRWEDARQPSSFEMKKTMFIAVEIEEASVKFRAHGVGDDPKDLERDTWAGLIPIHTQFGAPEQDPDSSIQTDLPEYLANYKRP
jgi:uncharacterized protein